MWECLEYKPNIRINLNNGLYSFISESATGKTYLLNILLEYKDFGLNVGGYTYRDVLCNRTVESYLSAHPEVFLIDRVDLYDDRLDWASIEEYSKNSIILLDYKNDNIDLIDDYVGVTFEAGLIEVY